MENKLTSFKNYISELYPDFQDDINSSLSKATAVVFRCNTLISDNLPKNISFINGPLKNTYILTNSADKALLTDTEEYLSGQIYIQNLSSMLAVQILDPKANENILDLCAAPGSKTSLIAQLTNNEALITAVENNRNRFFAMQKNLEHLQVRNTTLLLENASLLDHRHAEFIDCFDRVLADVPCSNESYVNYKETKSLDNWHPRSSKRLSHLQKGLLDNAVRMTKKGGTIVYSTCTYSPYENEQVLDWVLQRHPNLVIEHIELPQVTSVNGFTDWNGNKLNTQISNAKRIIPDGKFTAFFISKITKN